MRALLAALALAWLTSCGEEGPTYAPIDLHVDVRLNAIENNLAYSQFIAIGDAGTVVHYYERLYPQRRGEVVSWALGQDELWAVDSIMVFEHGVDTDERRWFVVGEAGTLHVGVEQGSSVHAASNASAAERFTWFAQPRIVATDLYGVAVVPTEAGVQAFAVGDEVMLAGTPTSEPGHYEWSALASPSARGWGTLRDITARWNSGGEWELWAVGDQGRVWYSDLGPAGWVGIETGTTDDLVDAAGICGHGGRWLDCDRGTCTSRSLDMLDFVACGDDWALAADQGIYDAREAMMLDRLDWQPRAAAGDRWSLLVVGEGGRAGEWKRPQPVHGAL